MIFNSGSVKLVCDFGVGRFHNRTRFLATPLLAAPFPRGGRGGTLLPFGFRLRAGLRLQPLLRCLNLGQTLVTPVQFVGQFITAATP